jgi:hypothetical protein
VLDTYRAFRQFERHLFTYKENNMTAQAAHAAAHAAAQDMWVTIANADTENLTPDQEEALAAKMVDVQGIVQGALQGVKDLLNKPG